MLSPLSDSFELIDREARFDAPWSFDPISGRYRNEKGRFISEASMQKLLDGRIEALSEQLKDFTKRLIEGNITLDQWQGSVREALKMNHLQAGIIGHGGRESLTQADYGRIGQRLRSEYAYLQNFANDLLGARISAPMALARIGMYAQAVRGSYWEGTTIRQEKQGYSLMRRILDPQAKHCDDCLRYAARGAVSIGSLPMPGQRCACMSNCKCRVQYMRQQAPVVAV